jgi:hypothetical protein
LTEQIQEQYIGTHQPTRKGPDMLAPLYRFELTDLTVAQLLDLARRYWGREADMALVVEALEAKGVDPYA